MTVPNPLLRMKRERRLALAVIVAALAVFWSMGRTCPPLVAVPSPVEQEVYEP